MDLSIVVTVHQTERQICQVLNALTRFTSSPFELVIVFDGCTDRSREIAESLLASQPGKATSVVMLDSPDVNETIANNLGMRAASGTHLILVQDDMEVLEDNWERRMLAPMEQWKDVFAVSARDAMNCSPASTLSTPRYSRLAAAQQFGDRELFAVRAVVNRGPLALRADVTRSLGYFDESYAPMHRDDSDLCLRARLELGYVCGTYNVVWRNLASTCRKVALERDGTFSNGMRLDDVVARNWRRFHRRYHRHFVDAYGANRKC